MNQTVHTLIINSHTKLISNPRVCCDKRLIVAASLRRYINFTWLAIVLSLSLQSLSTWRSFLRVCNMINRFIYLATSRFVVPAEENESWKNGAGAGESRRNL